METFYTEFMRKNDLLSGKGFALDLGSGHGRDSRYLKSLGYKVTSVDIQKHTGHIPTVISDIRHFDITKNRYDVIICNNVLSFIDNKKEVLAIIENIVHGLKKGGVAYISLYGKNSHFRNKRTDMSFYDYDQIVDFIEHLPVTIFQKLTKEGYAKDNKGNLLYHHSHRFILKK